MGRGRRSPSGPARSGGEQITSDPTRGFRGACRMAQDSRACRGISRATETDLGWRRSMASTHYVPADAVHFTWDAGHAPAVTIDSGDVIVVRTRDVSDNQLSPAS